MKSKCDICGFIKKANNSILETKYWVVLLADDQAYLGRCYITLKRHCGDLAIITNDEWKELQSVIKQLESTIRKTFNANMFNWTCLMNNAYQKAPFEPHVHWHFRPRYNRPIRFSGLLFNDPEFGYHYAREKERSMIVSIEVQNKIINKIKDNLVLTELP